MKKIQFKGSVLLNPVPVVMITSKNSEGKSNVFTVAWTGTICTKPPMLSISIRPERLSYDYIAETMEFIVNIPNSSMARETDFCGVVSGNKVDKIKQMEFTMVQGKEVDVDYIKECPVSIECKVKQIIKLGTHDLFLAEVVQSHIDENLMDENGKICLEKGKLLSYCHGEYFPMGEKPVGKFGYSVAKNKYIKQEYDEKYGAASKKKAGKFIIKK